MDFLNLTHDVLSVDYILKEVSSEKCGAVSMFVGTTRDNFEGKKVVRLEYEAYDVMALKAMKTICTDIRCKWPEVHNIAIYHRLGVVPVMEASVVIAISSPHRVDSISAVKYCIENLKDNPILSEEPRSVNSSTCDIIIDPGLVQVNASNSEIQRRIRNYIERKRDQINLCNVQDFINSGNNRDIQGCQDSCARVDAILVKRKGSKGHLNVLKANNEWGPQTKMVKIESREPETKNRGYKYGIEERLSNAETHLNVSLPIPSDIYGRLKKIEDRILELESLSPEYVMFWSKSSQQNNLDKISTEQPVKKMKYSSEDIKQKLEAMGYR